MCFTHSLQPVLITGAADESMKLEISQKNEQEPEIDEFSTWLPLSWEFNDQIFFSWVKTPYVSDARMS